MPSRIFIAAAVLAAASHLAVAQAGVRVEPAHLDGPRVLADQTEQAIVRDYLESWKSMSAALSENNPGLLAADFAGGAKDSLTDTIHQQAALGMSTLYRDRTHDLQIVFYSPEGSSIELIDNVEYEVQVFDHSKSLSAQQVRARYVVVLTPAEVRWRVRIFEAQPE